VCLGASTLDGGVGYGDGLGWLREGPSGSDRVPMKSIARVG
jgi:hypothetical protein